jgi:hypothetical protein
MGAVMLTIVLLVLCAVAYLVVATALSRPMLRAIGGPWAHCHSEPKSGFAFRWHMESDCLRFCRERCWRVPDTYSGASVAAASLGALLWPLALLPLYLLRTPPPVSAGALQAEISRLERALGIGS